MSDAVISDCGRYRYSLSRHFFGREADSDSIVFVMLNPSTADASEDDPTIRRCKGFAMNWGYQSLVVVNLYAFRATKRPDLWQAEDRVGPNNDAWLQHVAWNYKKIVFAWGADCEQERVHQVCQIFCNSPANIFCLGTTQSGQPRHPLYVRGDTQLVPFKYPK